MTNHAILRGIAAALLTVALVAPYAHPAYCDMSMHVQPIGTQAAVMGTHHAGSHHAQHADCHDQTTCGVVSVAPVLAPDTRLPSTTTVALVAMGTGEAFVDSPTSPTTPPPRT